MVLIKKIGKATDLSIDFSKYYRENRHGTKIIKVKLEADINENTENDGKYLWEARVKIPKKKGDIVWAFPDDCPEWIRNEVSQVYDYIHFEELLKGMTKKRACM